MIVSAQDLSLNVTVNKNPALLGEKILVKFSIDENAENFRGPNFKDIRIVSGPNPSTSSSYSFVNGKSQSKTNTTYSYVLIANKLGKIIIGSATVNVNGKTYKSNPINIEVAKNQNNYNYNNRSQNNKNKEPNLNDTQLYIKATTNKKKLYQGQQILVTYKLYTRLDLVTTELLTNPSLNGFWTQNIEVNSKFKREIINGVAFNVAIVKKVLLTAQKSGDLVIDPMEIRTQIRVQNRNNRRDPFDPFSMFNQYSTIEKTISSKPIKIKVEQLPIPKPNYFYEAVGDIKLKTEVNNSIVKANEAINFKVIISGNGNLSLLKPFEIAFPPDFEVYDPKIIDKTFSAKNRTSGKKIFEYLLIPRYEGKFEIPSIKYNYFNPLTKKYKSILTNKIPIEVLKGDEQESGINTFLNKEDVKLLNTDIRYIKTKSNLERKGKIFFRSTLFSILLLSPIILFFVLLIYFKILAKDSANSVFQKSRKATKVATKRLKNAQKHLNNNKKEHFYENIEKSLWGYFSDKFAVQIAELSKETIIYYFEKFYINKTTQSQFISLLNDCEIARYTTSKTDNTKMETILKAAQKIIIEVEEQKK